MLTIVLAGCNNGEKYTKDIDKVYKEQEKLNKEISLFSDKVNTKIDRDKSNTHVYKDGKVIIIGIQLFKRKINYITSIIILRMAKQNLMKKRINEIYEKT